MKPVTENLIVAVAGAVAGAVVGAFGARVQHAVWPYKPAADEEERRERERRTKRHAAVVAVYGKGVR